MYCRASVYWVYILLFSGSTVARETVARETRQEAQKEGFCQWQCCRFPGSDLSRRSRGPIPEAAKIKQEVCINKNIELCSIKCSVLHLSKSGRKSGSNIPQIKLPKIELPALPGSSSWQQSPPPSERGGLLKLPGVAVSPGGEVWFCPQCSKPDDGSPMIGCDGSCEGWYHW